MSQPSGPAGSRPHRGPVAGTRDAGGGGVGGGASRPDRGDVNAAGLPHTTGEVRPGIQGFILKLFHISDHNKK